ncbi:MAG: DUF5606 domain-containing protein [Weeksellaceae bacterium]|nr:DUF5606 domain-containing protein [Weeksellaceae bacterium]
MNLDKIIAIAGKPGLYKLLLQARNSFVAQNLETGKKTTIPATYNVNVLSNIAIYTTTGETQLTDIYDTIFQKENGGEAISHKAGEKELRTYFEEILPDYDIERVYHSDLKKLFQWYNLLQKNDLLQLSEEEETVEQNAASEEE